MMESDNQVEASKELARNNGWQRVGRGEVQTEVALTDFEKIDLGKSQSESIREIEHLEDQFGFVKQEFKNKIDGHKIIVKSTSEILSKGRKEITKTVPIFLDLQNGLKHFVDEETGEIIKSVTATEDDRQMRFG